MTSAEFLRFSVSIQDTLYALYTIQHQEPLLKYYKYYIVINFILFPPNCVKKYKIMPNNHMNLGLSSNFSSFLNLGKAKVTLFNISASIMQHLTKHLICYTFWYLNWGIRKVI